MKRTYILLALLACGMLACKQKKSSGTDAAGGPNKALDSLFNSYWEGRSKLSPLDATQQGDNRYNAILVNDQTQAYRDSLKNFYQHYLDEIKKFDYDALDENDKVSVDMFTYDMNMQLQGLAIGVIGGQVS